MNQTKKNSATKELDFKVALDALRHIRNKGGVICEDCSDLVAMHPECKCSYDSWRIAAVALEKIKQIQAGNYSESRS